MALFDWNVNGKDDMFDTFMDMKIISGFDDESESSSDDGDGFGYESEDY